MIVEVAFTFYLILLVLGVFYAGINSVRVKKKFGTHPKIFCFMLPFFINFLLAKTVFWDIHSFFSTLLPAIIMFLMSQRLDKVRIIGVTGGIATGKSTLIKLIKSNLNIEIIDCDEINRKLSVKGRPGYKFIIGLLGERAEQFTNHLTQDLDRQKLSRFVFHNEEFRRKLTKGMGNLIMRQIAKKVISNVLSQKYQMIIDAPILYETQVLTYICYPVVVVGCSEDEQIRRLADRNAYTQEQALSRIRSQMPLETKRRKCQIYLSNEGTEQDLLNGFLLKINRYMQKRFHSESK